MPRAVILLAALLSMTACGQAVTPDAAADAGVDSGDRNFDCVNNPNRQCDLGHICVVTACDGGLCGVCTPPRPGCSAEGCGINECPCTECDRMLCEDPNVCFKRIAGRPFVNCHPE